MNEDSSSAALLKGGPVGISSSEPLDSQGCLELQLREVPSQAVRGKRYKQAQGKASSGITCGKLVKVFMKLTCEAVVRERNRTS